MSEDLLFAKISEPEMTSINFDDNFRDRMREVDRGHIEVFPKLWNLRPYNNTPFSRIDTAEPSVEQEKEY